MPSLPNELFSLVERKILEARSAAEAAAEAAINALAVNRAEPFRSLSPDQRHLRNALRARARQLGGGSQVEGLKPLVEEIAYQQWHRMLFARFLAENGLLMHPDGIPVTLQDCAELAPEEGEPDAWALAAWYAGAMLPGIFRPDDPVVQVRFAPEGRLTLEGILAELPPLAFTADDALGWMYQFWQAQRKKDVQSSERKIGGADIAPVTQLFTEDYMVRFLLENSLGAWWAARHPGSLLVEEFTYLRFRDDGTPAAGTFPGWPDRAAQVTCMDPCGGSGHFVVAEFGMLRRMRMEEEGLSEADAGDAVIRDNLFMLEIDPRCTQIAAFVLVLAAWKSGGYRPLPVPNIACSGILVEGQLEAWTKLAGKDERLRRALERLYERLRNAPDLGSLINPTDLPERERMFTADYAEVEPLLEQALARERSADPVAGLFGAAAEGVAKAARLLAGRYTLVATNVPYLQRGRQHETLMLFCSRHHPAAKANLATAFLERCRVFTAAGGAYALVVAQEWLTQPTYQSLRKETLEGQTWNQVCPLGPRAFETVGGEVVNVSLFVATNSIPQSSTQMFGVDATEGRTPADKARLLVQAPLQSMAQAAHLGNPNARIVLGQALSGHLLLAYAASYQGMKTGDDPRRVRCFWEVGASTEQWRRLQTTTGATVPYGGRHLLLDWSMEGRDLARRQGLAAWGKIGVAANQMGALAVTLYTGDIYDSNVTVIVPMDPDYAPLLWQYCQSPEFRRNVRRVDKSIKATNSSFVQVPFDLQHWQAVAAAAGPLPGPHSDDPTQWLFKGHPAGSETPLQVAVTRLLGYRWPQQEPDALDALADADGIVCLPPVAGEPAASERLRALLAAAYGPDWSPARQDALLAGVGFAGQGLDVWLRDGFFPQHCRLFHNRPFIWHIWDGRKDGFSALIKYHRLDAADLDKLIYSYLQEWIRLQTGKRDAGEAGADGRLVAALELKKKLEAIRDGEPPCDIFVRWKPLHEQPIGWNPDLNDGVRLNIRPFVTAGVLRSRFTINWNKDRGKDPDGSERINDRHFTVAEKLEARRQWEANQEGQTAKKRKGQA